MCISISAKYISSHNFPAVEKESHNCILKGYCVSFSWKYEARKSLGQLWDKYKDIKFGFLLIPEYHRGEDSTNVSMNSLCTVRQRLDAGGLSTER